MGGSWNAYVVSISASEMRHSYPDLILPIGVPILGAFGPCIPASKRSNGLGMLMGATTALLFEVLATLFIIIVCAKTWYDRRATHMHGGVSLITVIMRESVGFWLCVVCIHGGNMWVFLSRNPSLCLNALFGLQCLDHRGLQPFRSLGRFFRGVGVNINLTNPAHHAKSEDGNRF